MTRSASVRAGAPTKKPYAAKIAHVIFAAYGFFVGAPAGLTLSAWVDFVLFAAVILGLILEPIPAAAIGLIGVTFAATMRYVNATPARPSPGR